MAVKKYQIQAYLLVFLIVLGVSGLYAQSVSHGPSTDASSQITANNTPVTLYAGKPNINIPLHTIDAHGINIPISINYNATGVKINQLASQVGLGWSLNAGGVVTREVRGYPDEMLENPGQSNAYKPVGYLHHGAYTDNLWDNPINGNNDLVANYYVPAVKHPPPPVFTGYTATLPVHGYVDPQTDNYTLAKDTEADIYHFNFGHYSGKFTFDALGQPHLLNDNKDLKIEYKLASGYAAPAKPYGMSHISSGNIGLLEWFTITTPDGTKYTFDKHEIQMSFNPKGIYSFPIQTPDECCLGDQAYLDEDLISHYVSAWYLTKIEHNENLVELSYLTEIETNHSVSQQLFPLRSEMNHTYTVTEVPVLAEINWGGREQVHFVRTDDVREDFYYPNSTLATKSAKALSRIIVSDNSLTRELKRINFAYDYFNKTGPTCGGPCAHNQDIIDVHKERLKLSSITVTENRGNGTPKLFPPYVFEYDNTALPSRHSNRKDYWGYFNGSQPGSYDLAPTIYEYPGDGVLKNVFLGQYSPIPYNTYTGTQTQISGIDRSPNAVSMQAGILKKITYPTGGYTAYEYESHKFATPAHTNPIEGGGLRIKKIIKSNGINELAENAIIKNFAYEDENGTPISGKLQSWLAFAHDDPFSGTVSCMVNHCGGGGGGFVSSNNQGVMPSSGGSLVLYPSVVVSSEGNRGKTVYSYDIPVAFNTEQADFYATDYIYKRTVSSLYTNHNQQSNAPYAPNPNYIWRIALTEKKVYNESGILLKKEVNEYEFAKAVKLKRIRFKLFNRGTQPSVSPTQPRTNNEYAKYYDISGWYRLKQKIIDTYDELNPLVFVSQQIDYGYSAQHKQVVETTLVNSDGIKSIIRKKFPFDYIIPASSSDPTVLALTEMKDRFMNTQPIEQISVTKTSTGVEAVIGGKLTKPSINVSTGNIVFGQTEAIETLEPIDITSSGFELSKIDASNNFSFYVDYKPQSNIDGYNSRDLPTQVKREYGQPSSMIWQTESPYALVGSVANAARTDVGYASFEQETFHSEWTFINNANNYITNGGYTGAKHYHLEGQFGAKGIFPVSNQFGKYKCSAWIKTTTGVSLVLYTRKLGQTGVIYPPTTSSTPSYKRTIVGNTGGEWKYVEVEIDLEAIQASYGHTPNGSTSLDIMDVLFHFWNPAQGTVEIDDVRFSPVGSPMKTMVYNNYNQLVSFLDFNNHKSSLEYTAEGKLLYARNEDGDILLANEYYISSSPSVPSFQKTTTVRSQGIKDDQDLDYLGINIFDEFSRTVAYYDGLMRPIQTNQIDASPSNEDIIQPLVYANYGQQEKKYLPYADGSGIAGAYRNNAIAEQTNFYDYLYQDLYGYNTKIYDESPLGRITAVRPVGNQFFNHPTNLLPSSYLRTNLSNEVRMLDGLYDQGYYPASSLVVDESQDAKGTKTWIYKDLLGRIIMVKQEVDSAVYAKTYYTYTKKGELLAIIPPEQTEVLEANNWTITTILSLMAPKNQLYLYDYDQRGRLVLKWTPEGKEQYVYDNLDQVVLINDAELQSNNQWKFVKYDNLGRSIISGLYTHGNNGIPVISGAIALHETKQNGGTHGYSNQAFPTTGINIHQVNYYDNYDKTGDGITNVSFTTVSTGNFATGWGGLFNGRVAQIDRLFGQLTMTKTAILGQSTVLESQIFYNHYGQVIQVKSDNHLGGNDQIDFINDYEGKVREARQVHSTTLGTPITIHETFSYDHVGRLLSQTHQVNSEPVITLKEHEYGLLGERKGLFLHSTSANNYLERIGYVQDIMNRTKYIHTNNGSGLYKEEISYDVNSNVNYTRFEMPVTRADGRIDMFPSGATVDDFAHSYTFSYDKLDRLTSAAHNTEVVFTGNPTVNNYGGRYTVNNITYNLNSDILSLDRKGFRGYTYLIGSTLANFGDLDLLTYTYHEGRLVGVADNGKDDMGFVEQTSANTAVDPLNPSTHEYLYNTNGHLIQDKNKGINTINYNHLNLATSIQMDNGTDQLDWLYTASGQKLRKTMTSTGVNHTRDYAGGVFEYANNTLESIGTAVGRVVPAIGGSFRYEYVLKDHQGNNRLTFSDMNSDGSLTTNEVLQQNHYYPFGMRMQAIDDNLSGVTNLYRYGAKEKQEEFGLNLLDYGPRYFDPSIARWHAPDILSEEYHYQSPFAYVSNNPVTLSDPTGMYEDDNREENEVNSEEPYRQYSDRVNSDWYNIEEDMLSELDYYSEEVKYGGMDDQTPPWNIYDWWDDYIRGEDYKSNNGNAEYYRDRSLSRERVEKLSQPQYSTKNGGRENRGRVGENTEKEGVVWDDIKLKKFIEFAKTDVKAYNNYYDNNKITMKNEKQKGTIVIQVGWMGDPGSSCKKSITGNDINPRLEYRNQDLKSKINKLVGKGFEVEVEHTQGNYDVQLIFKAPEIHQVKP